MTTPVRLTEGGPNRFVGGGEAFEPGDTREVSDDLAEFLLKKPFFERAHAAPAESDDEEFDLEAWLDQDYEVRAERVEAGEVDAHLEAIAEAETSDNVLDAIGVRRAELEE